MAGNLTEEKSCAQRDVQYGDLGFYHALKMESGDSVMMTYISDNEVISKML
jgi:hypothetical protein